MIITTTLYVFIICISLCVGDADSNINEDGTAAVITQQANGYGINIAGFNTLAETINYASGNRTNDQRLLAATECSQGITPRTQCPISAGDESQECSNCDELGATLALLENSNYGIVLNNFNTLINVLILSLTGGDRPLGQSNAEIAVQCDINSPNYCSTISNIINIADHDKIEMVELPGFNGLNDGGLKDLLEQENNNGKKKLVILGTPTNPCSECVDIIEICKKIKSHNRDNDEEVIVVFDNTQQTAPIHRPQEHCADIIINSGEILFGLGSELDCNKNPPLASIVTRNKQYYDYFVDYQKKNGLIISDSQRCCSSSHRLSTLNIRVKQQCSNAVVIATLLESSEIIEQVNYPGLACHSHHEICAKTMKCGGPTITFKIKEDSNGDKTTKFIECINESNVFNIKGNTVNYNNFIGGINTYFTSHNLCGNTDDRTPWIRMYTGIEDIYDIATATKRCLNQIDGSYQGRMRKINPDGSQQAA